MTQGLILCLEDLQLTAAFQGNTPLVIEAHSVDVISALILLKMEVERLKETAIKMTITGASEAHILAAEIASAGFTAGRHIRIA